MDYRLSAVNHRLNMTILERRLMDHLLLELQHSSSRLQTDLKKRFPQLTAYDLRLCVYLGANLSTKEIATLLNITPDSVKKAKHRLRRKLHLQPTAQWYEILI